MSISSSMNAGVSGLNANSTRLSTIADNIANSATNGYKRADVAFNSLVLGEAAGRGTYTAGGVRVNTMRVIEQNGPLITTDHPLDLAVTQRGMLPVTRIESMNRSSAAPPLSLTTTGSVRLDKDGVLRTESGLVLMGWPANADGSFPTPVRDSASGLQPIIVNQAQAAADPTRKIELAINLPATETAAGASGAPIPFSVEYFDNLGAAEKLSIAFTPDTSAPTGKTNLWTMEITDSATGAVIGEYEVQFDDAMGSGGSILSITALSGGAYDPATGMIALTVGSGTATGTIDLHIGEPGQANGLTQIGDRIQQAIGKDGSPAGSLIGLFVDENGLLKASYDTGFVRTLYKVPLVDVPNVNGLIARDDQTFQISTESGPLFLWDAGDGPTGTILGNVLEGSATDVAAELTRLIQTQRAYSSNAKIIQTVDEMLQETANLKR